MYYDHCANCLSVLSLNDVSVDIRCTAWLQLIRVRVCVLPRTAQLAVVLKPVARNYYRRYRCRASPPAEIIERLMTSHDETD